MPTCSQRDTWRTEHQAKMQLTNLNLSEVFLQSVAECCEVLGPFPLRSLDLQAEQSFPYAGALKCKGIPIRTDGNSLLLVVQSKRKTLGKQVSPGKTAQTPRLCPSDKFNCTGLFQAVADRSNIPSTCFPFITWHSPRFQHTPPVLAAEQSNMTYRLAKRRYLKLCWLTLPDSEVARKEFQEQEPQNCVWRRG